ncbi:MAG: hypothetical protein P0Y56_05375 [Candidatus Andeanibacterium colombiense]|uniref:Uncharacterized protein n=1 Tax=Candidatus Andeanibacterium colombiense TaxID=3121345 RepID=A0AAJ6BNT8_9SPHN|nr:MAG: hypothetical protein P0Y56_05375 [Sphingomonadaceae bacterium]
MRILLGGMLAAFLVGVAVTAVAVSTGVADGLRTNAEKLVEQQTGQKLSLSASPPPPSASYGAVAREQSELEGRVAGLEQRISRLDLQSQASAGNAARAEGLLVAYAARRAVERGQPLAYLESQLELRFGGAEEPAVKAVVAASRKPVTVEQLLGRLDGLSPALAGADGMSWARFERELSELFIVRKQSSPSPLPADRLMRARLRLQSGMYDEAIGEVENLPGGDSAAAARWIADARRYSDAIKGLDRIEQAALLDPHNLRDSIGKKVEQPGLANGIAP